MPTIEITKNHALGREGARAKAEEIARKLEEKLSLQWAWQGESVVFEAKGGAAKGAKGTIVVGERDLTVNVDLPFLLRPLKGMVESKIREKLDTF